MSVSSRKSWTTGALPLMIAAASGVPLRRSTALGSLSPRSSKYRVVMTRPRLAARWRRASIDRGCEGRSCSAPTGGGALRPHPVNRPSSLRPCTCPCDGVADDGGDAAEAVSLGRHFAGQKPDKGVTLQVTKGGVGMPKLGPQNAGEVRVERVCGRNCHFSEGKRIPCGTKGNARQTRRSGRHWSLPPDKFHLAGTTWPRISARVSGGRDSSALRPEARTRMSKAHGMVVMGAAGTSEKGVQRLRRRVT